MSDYTPSSHNNITFSCEYVTLYGNVNFVFPDQRCIAFEIPVAYSGENVVADSLYVFTPWYMFSGENIVADALVTYRILPLDGATSGEILTPSLTPFYSLGLDSNYTGQSINIVLMTLPSIELTLDSNYTGQSIEDVLLTTSPPIILPLNSEFSGETLTVNLQNNVTLASINNAGEYSEVTFSTYPFVTLSALYYSGETLSSNLATTYAIKDIAGYSGQTLTPTVEFHSPIELDTTLYCGSVLTPDLSTTIKFFFIDFSGEILTADLAVRSSSEMSADGYCGTESISSIASQYNLVLDSNYSGQVSELTGAIELTPNNYLYSGENLTVSLATFYLLTFDYYSGEIFGYDLDIHPSEPIGVFRFYNGTNSIFGVQVFYHVDFYVLIRATSAWMQVDINSATYFDLDKDCSCGKPRKLDGDSLDMALEDAEYYDNDASGDHIIFSVDLCTSKRFSTHFYTGQECTLKDYTDYFEVDFAQETGNLSAKFGSDDLKHHLCKGYFIPSSYNMIIELKDLLLEDCEVHRFYSGEIFYCVVSDDEVLQVDPLLAGQTCNLGDFEHIYPWEVVFETGDYADVDQSFYYASVGDNMYVNFYEEPITAYVGSYAECGGLISHYDVAFLEEGCLDNEFQYQNLSGDIVLELFTPAAVEGDPFRHELQAACYDIVRKTTTDILYSADVYSGEYAAFLMHLST